MALATIAQLNKAKSDLEKAKQHHEGLLDKKKAVAKAQIAAAQQAVKQAKNMTTKEMARNTQLTAALAKQQMQSIDAVTTLSIRAGQNATGVATSRAKQAASAVNESGIVGTKVQNALESIDSAATSALTANTNRNAALVANDALTSPSSGGLSNNMLLIGGVGAGAILLVVMLKKKKGKK